MRRNQGIYATKAALCANIKAYAQESRFMRNSDRSPGWVSSPYETIRRLRGAETNPAALPDLLPLISANQPRCGQYGVTSYRAVKSYLPAISFTLPGSRRNSMMISVFWSSMVPHPPVVQPENADNKTPRSPGPQSARTGGGRKRLGRTSRPQVARQVRDEDQARPRSKTKWLIDLDALREQPKS